MEKNESTSEFERRCAMLDAIDCDFRQAEEWRGKVGKGRKPHLLPQFSDVLLPLTPTQWCNLAMNEGEDYVGGCCGSSSAIQDMVEYWFRFDSGWASTMGLHELSERWVSHGDGYWESVEARVAFEDHHGLARDMWKAGTLEGAVEWVTTHRDEFQSMSAWDVILLCYFIVKDFSAPKMPISSNSAVHESPPASASKSTLLYTLRTGIVPTRRAWLCNGY